MRRLLIGFVALAVLIVLLCVATLCFGAVSIPFASVVQALFSPGADISSNILWNLRIPRMIAAVLTGASLAVSGLSLQTVFRNPLAGPFVLGISSGASLGVYGWIFPRDGKEVNVGFVLSKDAKPDMPLREKLKQFIANHFPEATIKAIYGGMIACGQSNKPLAKCGLFKAGDAASCVNPMSRSGIVESLISGKIAAEAVHEWLDAADDAARSRDDAHVERWRQCPEGL